jgi:DNA modification methylase
VEPRPEAPDSASAHELHRDGPPGPAFHARGAAYNDRLTFGCPDLPPNRLILGDNLQVMQALPPGTLALMYADPPFFTGREHTAPALNGSAPSSFPDVWPGGRDAYMGWLMERLAVMRALLTPSGSLFVHLDRRAVHYVKVELDRLFGEDCFVNEIIWHYTGGGRSRRYFSHKHDTILWYAKGPGWTFNLEAVRQPYKPTSGYARGGIVSAAGKRYLPHPDGTPADDVWDIPIVNPLARERTGYPTQKPEALLERIIAAASNTGDLVADFFCGSGTTAAVAQRLGRRWIACDVSPAAVQTARDRLARMQPPADVPFPDIVVEPWGE